MKKLVVTLVSIILASYLFTLVSGYSLVIPLNSNTSIENIDCVKGEINPLSKFDFTKGYWVMYIVIDLSDIEDLPTEIRKVNCFKTDNFEILNNLKSTWNFKCAGGDMATVSSDLYLINDGKIVFTAGLMINNFLEGLQSESFGWIYSNDNLISKSLVNFKRVYSPIVILPAGAEMLSMPK